MNRSNAVIGVLMATVGLPAWLVSAVLAFEVGRLATNTGFGASSAHTPRYCPAAGTAPAIRGRTAHQAITPRDSLPDRAGFRSSRYS